MYYVFVLLFLIFSTPVFAGQALIINTEGDPVLWDNSSALSIHPESGECGPKTNAQILSLIATNLQQWTDVSYVDLSFTVASGSISGVDGCNYTDYLAGVSGNTTAQSTANVQDGLNPILFDNDGEMTDSATGVSNGRYTILGFANPAGFSVSSSDSSLYTAIVDGQAVFNCYCLDDGTGSPSHSDCGSVVFTTHDLDFTMVHEMGHFVNLDHSQINASLVSDGITSNDDSIPTMYPQSVNAEVQKTPMEDDKVALASLYPTSTFFTAGSASSDYCKVTATLKDQFGEAMRCADVQFVDSASDAFNVSFASGAYAVGVDNNADSDTVDSGECTSGCGGVETYLLPGRTYTLNIKPFNSSFTGGSGISPCSNSQLTECTAAIIARCTDSDSSTSCSACVEDETITTNDAAENISTKITTECTAGATVSLGDISTTSVSSTSSATQTLVKALTVSNLFDDLDNTSKLMTFSGYTKYATSCPESTGSTTSSSGSSSSSSSCSLQQTPGVVLSMGGSLMTIPFGFLIWGGAFFLLGLIRFIHTRIKK